MALLRTLVVAVDAEGLMRAAPRLGRTRSAVSLQMRRLEELAGTRLLRKQGRRLVLTPAGEVLLGYARRILQLNDEGLAALGAGADAGPVRLGAPQDLAQRWLPRALARFARAHPRVALTARVDGNAALAEALDRGQLDLALVFGEALPGQAERLAELPMTWIARPGLALPPAGSPLPLVLLDAPCLFRRAATAALDRAGLPWRVAFSSPSLSAIWAAVEAGLGVTARTEVGVPGRLRTGWRPRRLPPLPEVSLWLCGGALAAPAAALRAILLELLVPELPGVGRASSARGTAGR
jgi:DNA-binding transcriptional LysR family regulator